MSLLMETFGHGALEREGVSAAVSQAGRRGAEPGADRAADAGAPAVLPAAGERPVRHRFGARPLFMAERRGPQRSRLVHVVAGGLLCFAAGVACVDSPLAPWRTRGRIAVEPPPLATPVPAPAAAPMARRKPRPVARGERPAAPAEELLSLPLPEMERAQVSRRAPETLIDERLALAYAAYQRGDDVAARAAYEEVAAADARNRQASLGLAAIAVRQGDSARARESYLRLLERDPDDPLALAGLLDLEPPADPVVWESRLKALLGRHPEVVPLHRLLGELHVRQQRWAEARQCFARALALDARAARDSGGPDPDLAFNLAVALEHLGQREQALGQYRAALDSARRRKPSFEPAVVDARVRALSEL